MKSRKKFVSAVAYVDTPEPGSLDRHVATLLGEARIVA
jgi:hypothetical protein